MVICILELSSRIPELDARAWGWAFELDAVARLTCFKKLKEFLKPENVLGDNIDKPH
jgi:hypothetical protein